MKKTFLVGGFGVVLLLLVLSFLVNRAPSLSPKHGSVDTRLFSGDSLSQPVVVAFGGGEGGNDWERNYLKAQRDELLARGFAVLAIGYFNTENSPNSLDRICLNALSDTILNIARRYPQLDTARIILMGASKGAELVLNLGSRFPQFKGVVVLSTSHVSFPALTISANTSSWQYNGLEVPYVPAPFSTIWPALKGDLFAAFSLMLEDEKAVKQAEIEVERINGPILILSGKEDNQWPATAMSDRIIARLAQNNFKHSYRHLALEGGHIEPLNHFDKVFDFLEKEFKK